MDCRALAALTTAHLEKKLYSFRSSWMYLYVPILAATKQKGLVFLLIYLTGPVLAQDSDLLERQQRSALFRVAYPFIVTFFP